MKIENNMLLKKSNEKDGEPTYFLIERMNKGFIEGCPYDKKYNKTIPERLSLYKNTIKYVFGKKASKKEKEEFLKKKTAEAL